jgi:hypothetical protein
MWLMRELTSKAAVPGTGIERPAFQIIRPALGDLIRIKSIRCQTNKDRGGTVAAAQASALKPQIEGVQYCEMPVS